MQIMSQKLLKCKTNKGIFDLWLQTNVLYHPTNFCRLCLDYIRNSMSIRQLPLGNNYATQILHCRKVFCMLLLEWYSMFHSTAPLHIFLQTYNRNRNKIFLVNYYRSSGYYAISNGKSLQKSYNDLHEYHGLGSVILQHRSNLTAALLPAFLFV